MGKQINELENYIKALEKFELPNYADLPEIPLYMEQVIGYVKEALKELGVDENSTITPYMVNNYVKAKIIEPPIEKKYTKDHIGYLIAISLMKSVISMSDVSTLIDIDSHLGTDVNNLYTLFKGMQEDAIHNVIRKVKVRAEFLKRNEKKKKGSNKKDDYFNLAYIALKLYIDAEANKLVADQIMAKISKDMIPTSKEEAKNKKADLKSAKNTK